MPATAWEAHTCPICNATVPNHIPHNCNDFMTPPDGSANRWAAFTDEEMGILSSNVSGDTDLTQDIMAECRRRGMDDR